MAAAQAKQSAKGKGGASSAKRAQGQGRPAGQGSRQRQGTPPPGASAKLAASGVVLGGGKGAEPGPPPRLKERYVAEIAPALREEFSYPNVMQIPSLSKMVVNMGVGEAARDSKLIDGAVRDLTIITGQKPAVARARKSVAQFKLREGMPIGAHVTLRGNRMWEFCDRLLTLALPRIRDFRGLSDRQFDGGGNYTFGLTEQLMFHEINPDQVDRQRGMDVTVVTTATNDDEGRSLLRRLGFPFKES